MENGIDKIRINPGNIGGEDRAAAGRCENGAGEEYPDKDRR